MGPIEIDADNYTLVTVMQEVPVLVYLADKVSPAGVLAYRQAATLADSLGDEVLVATVDANVHARIVNGLAQGELPQALLLCDGYVAARRAPLGGIESTERFVRKALADVSERRRRQEALEAARKTKRRWPWRR